MHRSDEIHEAMSDHDEGAWPANHEIAEVLVEFERWCSAAEADPVVQDR